MRFPAVLLLTLAMLTIGQPAAAVQPSSKRIETGALDHILLWGRTIDEATAVLTTKLGFQVVPGRNPGGVANRYLRMADGSYIELLGITRPNAEMDPGMLADQASLRGGAGARTFGLRTPMLDARREQLVAQGFAPTDVFSASLNDPDGDGPSHPPRWRLFAFERPPLSSHLFFIDYAALDAVPARMADLRLARQQPNGALAVTAIWLLSEDAGADRDRLARMGFAGATPVRLPQLSAHGYCVPVGDKHLLALQPDGPGVAADALNTGGPQVLGIDVGVADLEAARRRVARGYETELAMYEGVSGLSFLAPTRDDLGLLIEFHAQSSPTACPSIGH